MVHTPSRITIEQVIRENHGRMLAALTYQFGDLELAEDVLQEAAIVALQNWQQQIPTNPAAWLMQTAKRKAIDSLRRSQNLHNKTGQMAILQQIEQELMENQDNFHDAEIPDQRLRLIFTCCHPSIDERVRIALTLRSLCGLSTAQIAKAYVIPEKTMAQQLVRAKRKIKAAGIAYEVPSTDLLPERLSAVLTVVYLIFNEGYFGSTGDELITSSFCEEAIHLGSILSYLMPSETEATGLLAMMLFHHSRSDARTDTRGNLIELQHQDRSKWDKTLNARADKILKSPLMIGKPGPYQIQAAISAVHSHAINFAETDWMQIVMLYRKLEQFDHNPVIQLNLAVALSYAEDAQTALIYMQQTASLQQLSEYMPYALAQAELYARTGDRESARQYYQRAIALSDNSIERTYLQQKADLLA